VSRPPCRSDGLGSPGAYIGARFLASQEATIHPRYRECRSTFGNGNSAEQVSLSVNLSEDFTVCVADFSRFLNCNSRSLWVGILTHPYWKA
jgi:hypothetical protein